MSSDLFQLVYQDQLAELEQREQAWREAMQKSVEHVFISRFPLAPVKLIHSIRQIREAMRLQALHDLILTTDDVARVEQAIGAATENQQP